MEKRKYIECRIKTELASWMCPVIKLHEFFNGKKKYWMKNKNRVGKMDVFGELGNGFELKRAFLEWIRNRLCGLL